MSRLDYPFDRGPPSKNPAVLATALQSGPTTLFFGARPARPAPKFARTCTTAEASFRPIKPSCGAPHPERTSPRVQPIGPCCMSVVEFLRTTIVAYTRTEKLLVAPIRQPMLGRGETGIIVLA